MHYICLVFILVFLPQAVMSSTDINEIVLKIDDYRGYRGHKFKFKVRSISYENNKKIRSNVVEVYFKNPKNVLVSFLDPKRDHGRKILIDDENMWLYFPSVKNAIRISPIDRLIGEASNGDVANTDYTAYTHELIGEEELNGQKTLHITLHGKEKHATYKQVDLWVNDKNYRPIMSKHYGVSGKLLKTVFYVSFRKSNSREFVFEVKLTSAHAKNSYTIMEFYDYELFNMADSFFEK